MIAEAYSAAPNNTIRDSNVVKTSKEVDTNPKRQYGISSLPLHIWPPLASAYGVTALWNGATKYGLGNYTATPVEASIYVAATQRHLASWVSGEEFDPVDGTPHLGSVLANIAIIIEAHAAGTLIDDRPLSEGYLKERAMLTEICKAVSEKNSDKNPRHYTIADKKT